MGTGNKVTTIVGTWPGRWLTLKRWAEEVNVFIASVITYYLSVILCPDSPLNNLERQLFQFLWERNVTLYLLPASVKRWTGDALTVDAQRCIGIEASEALPAY